MSNRGKPRASPLLVLAILATATLAAGCATERAAIQLGWATARDTKKDEIVEVRKEDFGDLENPGRINAVGDGSKFVRNLMIADRNIREHIQSHGVPSHFRWREVKGGMSRTYDLYYFDDGKKYSFEEKILSTNLRGIATKPANEESIPNYEKRVITARFHNTRAKSKSTVAPTGVSPKSTGGESSRVKAKEAAPAVSVNATLSFDEAKDRGLKIKKRPSIDLAGATPLEKRLGSSAIAGVETFARPFEDPELTPKIEEIGRRLAGMSERPNMPYRFALYESEVPNALSLPDGSIFVSLGMASQCEGDDQIAAILAHEIAHVSCKHSLKAYDRLLTVQALSTITQIALIASGQSQASVDWAGLGSSLAGQLIDKGYTRTQEHEADQVGAVYLAKAGYDPLAMVDVFARIEELQGNRGSGFNKTHPFPKDRIKQVGLFVDAGLPDEQGKSIVVAAKDREPRMHSVAMQTMTVVEETSVGRDPASWKSLTPGKSTLDEAIQALGTPVSRDESGPGFARARFGDAGKEVVISTDENVIEIIEVMPDVMMSASDLEAAFGKPERESRNDDFIRLWHYGDGRTFVFRKDNRTVDRIIYADL